MKRNSASSLMAACVAAAVLFPLTCAAQNTTRQGGNTSGNKAETASPPEAETLSPAVSQAIDRADARIAILKADLRLTPEQDQHWTALRTTLHDIAAKRAESWAVSNEVQTGRASSTAANERETRAAAGDDIEQMRDQADVYTMEAAELRQIADAAQPLYSLLDERQRHRLVRFVHEEMKADRMLWRSQRF